LKRLIISFGILLLALVVLAVEPFKVDYTSQIAFSISDANDTARVVKVTPSHALDSFLYVCSLSFTADTSNWDTATWVSPVQQMKLTVGWDSAHTYQCSVDLGTNVYGFDYAASGNDDSTLAVLIDTLVYLWNNTAGMKDTTIAHDSVTYIKIVSLFAQIELEGDARWIAAAGDSLDTTSIWVTSVADVCDSMPARINRSDSNGYFTGYDSTTFYIIQSDKKGLTFHLAPTDTVQDEDTTTTQENVVSSSSDSGTVTICDLKGYMGLDGGIILSIPGGSYAGLGDTGQNSGSCSLRAYTGTWDGRKELARDSSATFPCTLPLLIDNVATSDSLLEDDLQIWWWIGDTVSDTNLDLTFIVE
jgi:hypothetical protein